MTYVDLNTIDNPTTGQPILAAWGDQVRANQEFFIDPPACSVYNSTSQSIPNNSTTVLTANSENYDNDSMHSTSSNTSRITIQTAGRYLLTAVVSFDPNSSGRRGMSFYVNGTTSIAGPFLPPVSTGNSTQMVNVRSAVLSASDYVECRAFQDSGGSLDVDLTEFAALFLTR